MYCYSWVSKAAVLVVGAESMTVLVGERWPGARVMARVMMTDMQTLDPDLRMQVQTRGYSFHCQAEIAYQARENT